MQNGKWSCLRKVASSCEEKETPRPMLKSANIPCFLKIMKFSICGFEGTERFFNCIINYCVNFWLLSGFCKQREVIKNLSTELQYREGFAFFTTLPVMDLINPCVDPSVKILKQFSNTLLFCYSSVSYIWYEVFIQCFEKVLKPFKPAFGRSFT